MADEIDLQILRIVQREGRLSMQELSSRSGIPAATCWRRLKALEANTTIRSYHALLDKARTGFAVTAFVHITAERQNQEIVTQLDRALQRLPQVLECYATTGDADYTLRVVARDIEDYDQFLQHLFELKGIAQVRSSIALREIKSTSELPI